MLTDHASGKAAGPDLVEEGDGEAEQCQWMLRRVAKGVQVVRDGICMTSLQGSPSISCLMQDQASINARIAKAAPHLRRMIGALHGPAPHQHAVRVFRAYHFGGQSQGKAHTSCRHTDWVSCSVAHMGTRPLVSTDVPAKTRCAPAAA